MTGATRDVASPEVFVGHVVIFSASGRVKVERTHERLTLRGVFIGECIVVWKPAVTLTYEREDDVLLRGIFVGFGCRLGMGAEHG